MIASLALSIVAACVFTEFLGYWLHILLHSDKIEFLSRNHMIHHLVVYSPNRAQRQSTEYLSSTYDRASVLGIGMEWLAPIAIILPLMVLALSSLGVGVTSQIAFVATSLAWGHFMFGYMHDRLHMKGFWMERSGFFGRWFLKARKLHDVHHMDLADSGKMTKNFGICFFFFDHLFASFSAEHDKFNRRGLLAAMERYAYIFPEWKAPAGLKTSSI